MFIHPTRLAAAHTVAKQPQDADRKQPAMPDGLPHETHAAANCDTGHIGQTRLNFGPQFSCHDLVGIKAQNPTRIAFDLIQSQLNCVA